MAQDQPLDTLHNSASEAENTVQDDGEIAATPVAAKPSPIYTPPRLGKTKEPGPPKWLVDGLFLAEASNCLGGDPRVGKMRMAAHIAACVASGLPFLGREVQQGPVLYLDFDDAELLPRMWMNRAVRGLGFDALKDLPIYYWDPSAGQFEVDKSRGLLNDDVFNHIIAWSDGIIFNEGVPPALIVIDTYASAFPSSDGNHGNDVVAVYERVKQLRLACGNTTVIVIDHKPKDRPGDNPGRGVSGSQQKKAKVRTQHLLSTTQHPVSPNSDFIEWRVDKNNAAKVLPPFAVRRELDENDDTDRIYVDTWMNFQGIQAPLKRIRQVYSWSKPSDLPADLQ